MREGPSEPGLQEQVPNHLRRLWSKPKTGAGKFDVFIEPGTTTLIPEPSAVITLSCHRLTADYVSTRRPLESHSFNSLRFHRGWCPGPRLPGATNFGGPDVPTNPALRSQSLWVHAAVLHALDDRTALDDGSRPRKGALTASKFPKLVR